MKDTANSPDSYIHNIFFVVFTAAAAAAAKSRWLVAKFICLHVVAPIDLHVCSRFRVAT